MLEPPTETERSLLQFLADADAVARKRGDEYGLCDCIDNNGNPYPSQGLADWLEWGASHGVKADDYLLSKPEPDHARD